MKEWITVSEAALRVNVPEKRIQNWIKEQYITAKIEDGGYLVDFDSLKKFVKEVISDNSFGKKVGINTPHTYFPTNEKTNSNEVGNTISQDEKLLKKFDMFNNITGNVYALCLTDKRIVIEFVKGGLERGLENLGCIFNMLSIIIGVGLGSLIFEILSFIANKAEIRGTEASLLIFVSTIAAGIGIIGICRNIKDILIARGEKKDIVVNYNDILRVILKRKSVPIGHSKLKMESIERKLVLRFKKENFDDVSQLLINLLPNKVELK